MKGRGAAAGGQARLRAGASRPGEVRNARPRRAPARLDPAGPTD